MTREQLIKRLGAASLMAVLAGLSVPAQAAEMKCRIPFSFTLNEKTLPPGIYTISTEVVPGALWVRGLGHAAVAVTHRIESRDDAQQRLVFYKYGERYVLREAWLGAGMVRETPEPRVERELKRNGGLAGRFERVVVPAL